MLTTYLALPAEMQLSTVWTTIEMESKILTVYQLYPENGKIAHFSMRNDKSQVLNTTSILEVVHYH